jgi:hypothetical protein
MSAYTTRHVTRDTARSLLIDKLVNISDHDLERVLDMLYERTLYNFLIVGKELVDDSNED